MKPKSFILYFWCFLLISLTAGLLNGNFSPAGAALAGESSPQSKLDDAINRYNAAQFDGAITILLELANMEPGDDTIQRTALWYLGRCYVAKKQNDKAKEAIIEVIRHEPPPFEPDPDKESPVVLQIYYQARKEKSGDFQVERPDPGVQTLAVVDFKNRSIIEKSEQFDPLEKGFSDMMINSLNGATKLKVVERDRIQWILQEHEIQDRYGMEGAVRAGKLLGVHVVILGSFMIHNSKEIWLSARAVKVETGEILLTADEKGKVDKLFELNEKLSNKIARQIEAEKLYIPIGEVPNSLDALKAYSEGIDLLERNRFDEAYQKFMLALEYDSGYERARKKAESIRLLTSFASR
jgi:TolB-like protein